MAEGVPDGAGVAVGVAGLGVLLGVGGIGVAVGVAGLAVLLGVGGIGVEVGAGVAVGAATVLLFVTATFVYVGKHCPVDVLVK